MSADRSWMPKKWRRGPFAGFPRLACARFRGDVFVTNGYAAIVAPRGWEPDDGASWVPNTDIFCRWECESVVPASTIDWGRSNVSTPLARLDCRICVDRVLWDLVREAYPGAIVYLGPDSLFMRCGDRVVGAIARFAGIFIPDTEAA